MKNKDLKIRTIIAAFALAVACFYLGFIFSPGLKAAFSPPSNGPFTQDDWRLFSETLNTVQQEYLEKDISPSQMMKGILKGLVNSLGDPYSQFLDSESYKEWSSEISGTYGGVGMEIGAKDSKPTVISVFPGSPAERAGIRSGDHFLKVDDSYVEGLSVSEIASKVRGEPGSQVKLLLERNGELLEFTLTRELITIQTVSFRVVKDQIGYIQLLGFKEQTAMDFGDALEQLTRHGVTRLILDLRQNPGGLLSSVIDVASYLVPAAQTVVIIEDRDGKQKYSRSDPFLPKYSFEKIVVLVDGGTASASEILAGALQDHKLATLIGQTTFGKGIVQTVSPLSQGNAVILTTSRYLTPSGRSIHKIGITPDIEVVPSPSDIEQGKDPVFDKALEVLTSD
ncbi:MAG: S41 family peptidase [Caldiserica bacterium]|nr:S41 family peptidase [Caldisericota bacterium]MDH7562868.1 S41 family peptidase [Caldisericota bacterium]